MHTDPVAVRKSVRTYLMVGGALFVFTVITVLINQIHLPVPAAIGLALVVASIKASMVAAVFMHLSHERRWIYGSLVVTAVGFVILMLVPVFVTTDTIGQSVEGPAATHQEGAGERNH